MFVCPQQRILIFDRGTFPLRDSRRSHWRLRAIHKKYSTGSRDSVVTEVSVLQGNGCIQWRNQRTFWASRCRGGGRSMGPFQTCSSEIYSQQIIQFSEFSPSSLPSISARLYFQQYIFNHSLSLLLPCKPFVLPLSQHIQCKICNQQFSTIHFKIRLDGVPTWMYSYDTVWVFGGIRHCK